MHAYLYLYIYICIYTHIYMYGHELTPCVIVTAFNYFFNQFSVSLDIMIHIRARNINDGIIGTAVQAYYLVHIIIHYIFTIIIDSNIHTEGFIHRMKEPG